MIVVILVVLVTFGLCWLCDKGFAKVFRNQEQHHTGLAVRLSKRYAVFGLLSAVLGLSAVFAGAGKNTLLLVGGIVISALGAVMDVTMGIASSLSEVHTANPKLSRRELFRSGMNIGRDMVGTMTNTLILAFLGSGFTLILYLYSLGLSPRQLLSSAYVSLEVVSGVASSVGVILSIPLTALITAEVFTREKKSGKSA